MPSVMEHNVATPPEKPNPGHEPLPGLTGRARWAVCTSAATMAEVQGRSRYGAPGGGAVGSLSENRQGGGQTALPGLTLKPSDIRCISPERPCAIPPVHRVR